jgi:hypothetical protein
VGCQSIFGGSRKFFELYRFQEMYVKLINKVNKLNLYIQETQGADIFAVHDKVKGFLKKLTLWQNNIEKQNYVCF